MTRPRSIPRAALPPADGDNRCGPADPDQDSDEPGALPQSVYIVEPAVAEPGKWVVYYTERGEIYPEEIFDDEDSACGFVYTNLLKPSE